MQQDLVVFKGQCRSGSHWKGCRMDDFKYRLACGVGLFTECKCHRLMTYVMGKLKVGEEISVQ